MNAHALPLRQLSHAQARISRRLTREPWMEFSVADQPGRLTLKTSHRQPADASLHWFDSALGALGFSDAQAVLNAWSGCPAFVDADSAESWMWPLYNAGLSAELAAVLGSLQPMAPPDEQDALTYCELTLQLSQGRIDSVLAVPSQALADWLEQPAWNVNPPGDHSGLTLTFAVRLGSLSLPRHAVASLRPGDVVCPGEADFDTAGNGVLAMGPRQVLVRVGEQSDRLQLEVLEIEERTVVDRDELDQPIDESAETWAQDQIQADGGYAQDAYVNDDADHDTERYNGEQYADEPTADSTDDYADAEQTPDHPSAPASPTEAFADLVMPLTLRCGQVRLTLGELATLVPGSVLDIPGVTPGLAGLYYGERRLAQGELVEVEGRLGLQILQLDERG